MCIACLHEEPIRVIIVILRLKLSGGRDRLNWHSGLISGLEIDMVEFIEEEAVTGARQFHIR